MPDLALAPNGKTPPPDAQVKGGAMRLGEILVARGLVRVSDVEKAVVRQHELGGWLGDNLIALGYLTTDQLATVINATPPLPNTLAETGISPRNLLNLMLKLMHLESLETVPELSDRMKLPHRVLQQLMDEAAQQR